jgi:hypothetical protein
MKHSLNLRTIEWQKSNSGTGNRTLGSAVLISQVMRARNVSHYTIPDEWFIIIDRMFTESLYTGLQLSMPRRSIIKTHACIDSHV